MEHALGQSELLLNDERMGKITPKKGTGVAKLTGRIETQTHTAKPTDLVIVWEQEINNGRVAAGTCGWQPRGGGGVRRHKLRVAVGETGCSVTSDRAG